MGGEFGKTYDDHRNPRKWTAASSTSMSAGVCRWTGPWACPELPEVSRLLARDTSDRLRAPDARSVWTMIIMEKSGTDRRCGARLLQSRRHSPGGGGRLGTVDVARRQSAEYRRIPLRPELVRAPSCSARRVAPHAALLRTPRCQSSSRRDARTPLTSLRHRGDRSAAPARQVCGTAMTGPAWHTDARSARPGTKFLPQDR